MTEFSDILYGTIHLPDWLSPFLKLPEFVRLRGVRLSNVDSYQFKDLAGPCRWEHCTAVAWLAMKCADRRKLSEKDRVHLVLAALLHDVATPPFAHTAEYVLQGFDHEVECQMLLSARSDDDFVADTPVFAAQLPQFRKTCEQLARKARLRIDPDDVAQMVVGDGENGFLIHGLVDLDNADNVTRACLYMGIPVDPTVPQRVAEWLGSLQVPPVDLGAVSDPAVAEWLQYRSQLYTRFFDASDEELGRQAFLQHLMRRAIAAGMSRRSLIWNTDERLLLQMEQIKEENSHIHRPTLQELVERYRLLEAPVKIAHLSVDDLDVLEAISPPQTVAWIEERLSTPYFQPFAMVIRARGGNDGKCTSLFPPSPGALLLFKLGEPLKTFNLPEWIRPAGRDSFADSTVTQRQFAQVLRSRVAEWCSTRPWAELVPTRQASVISNLSHFGNWSFRLSRNESLHPYPGTFVHAIPGALITSLGVQSDVLVDPFGGTGQTAVEAVRHGCSVISADVNEIASLTAMARLTYLNAAARERLRGIVAQDIHCGQPAQLPDFELREKWFHPETLSDIGRIKTYIDRRRNPLVRQFLTVALSACVTSCTARYGKEHGYFADNTPLAREVKYPPRRDALELFLNRVERNLETVERLYGQLERDGFDPELALSRAKVLRVDVRSAQPCDYGIKERSVGAIITSPPYLCMADYTLGQRLSYELLFPAAMKRDFAAEIGSRRQRFQRERALHDYRQYLDRFACLAREMLRIGGFLAIVVGRPTAADYTDLDLTADLDSMLSKSHFEKLWETWRPINWHRNHGYARLKQERISVHVARA
jgi:HD superfamily phosphohydrolase